MTFSKEIAGYFFSKGPDILVEGGRKKNIFSCKCAVVVGRECSSSKNAFSLYSTAGFGNLKSHLKECIPDFQTVYDRQVRNCPDSRNQFVVPPESENQNVYGWVDWVITCDLPLSFADEQLTHLNAKWDPINSSFLLKYLDQLAFECEGVLSGALPDRFGLIFDIWDGGQNTDYCGVFVTWYDTQRECTRTHFLRLAVLLRDDDATIDSRVESLRAVLAKVGKSWDNVVVIMGDNTEESFAIAKRTNKLFLGCFANRLSLGVKVLMAGHEEELNTVHTLMVALSAHKYRGTFREVGCLLRPVGRSANRWMSAFLMLQRYFDIRPYLEVGPWLELYEVIGDLLPSEAQDVTLRALFEDLKKCESVAKGLQRADLFDARAALNWLAEKYPQMAPKIGPAFCDPLWRAFERGAAKVQGGQEASLAEDEIAALMPFLINPDGGPSPTGPSAEDDNFEAIVKRARLVVPVQLTTRYINLSFLRAETKVIDRLFTDTRKLWRERRSTMTPARAELIVFLKCNRELWDQQLVSKCRNSPRLAGAMVAGGAGAEEAVWAIAGGGPARPFAIQLTYPTMAGYQFSFCGTGDDAEYWVDRDEERFQRNYSLCDEAES